MNSEDKYVNQKDHIAIQTPIVGVGFSDQLETTKAKMNYRLNRK